MPTCIKPLQPPDSFHLSAAEGWLELGDSWAANEELEKVTPELKSHPAVLEIRWRILCKEECWRACVDIAKALTQLTPSEPTAWIHLAYSTKQVVGGGLEAAVEVLKPGVEHFPGNPLFCFYLAIYTIQLDRLVESTIWWDKGMEVAQKHHWSNKIPLTSLDDPDLRPLLKDICKS